MMVRALCMNRHGAVYIALDGIDCLSQLGTLARMLGSRAVLFASVAGEDPWWYRAVSNPIGRGTNGV